jgi:type I restriction enzyme R subunit
VNAFAESVVEEAALAWLESLGWQVSHGPDHAPDMPAAEWSGYGEWMLSARHHARIDS